MRRIAAAVVAALACAGVARAQDITAVWGAGANDIWVLSPDRAFHYDGRAWRPVPTALAANWTAVSGSGPGDVWAVGSKAGASDTGVMQHWDGGAWTGVPAPGRAAFLAVAALPSSVVVLENRVNDDAVYNVLVWNGRTWTRQPLPFRFVAVGLKVMGGSVYVAGYAYHDPRPTVRNQYGVLLRRSATGAWVPSGGWNGVRNTDAVVGAAAWSAFDVVGTTALLLGDDTSGPRVALMTGGAWRALPSPAVPPDGDYFHNGFLLGDGTPVLQYQHSGGDGFVRYDGTRWVPMAAPAAPDAAGLSGYLSRGGVTWSPAGTGYAYTIGNGAYLLRIDPSAMQATFSVLCYPPPSDGETVRMCSQASLNAAAGPPGAAPSSAAPANAAASSAPASAAPSPAASRKAGRAPPSLAPASAPPSAPAPLPAPTRPPKHP